MAGVGSRRRCEEFIVAGRVRVDGVVVSELGARVDPSRQRVEFDGRRVQPEPMQTYLADKPRGVLCTSADPEGRPTIVEWAVHAGANPRLRLYSVGRLDYDSEGLILLTNDGELAQRLAHPRHHTLRMMVSGFGPWRYCRKKPAHGRRAELFWAKGGGGTFAVCWSISGCGCGGCGVSVSAG